ncbi:pseudouridine synthase [Saliterribacillus persicus]|uniref:Pseudouridine synthase n=1 Tax=Saliterribacillus persicus TaxID=930114 RepID=A0A368X8E3_9BACI|nr:pseudouridine synthase [Saliterribacillus persicus]RCW62677.1 ribosomal small subunit pseudouridine synthase A [Saliterribacillus persicus]
MRLDKFLSNMGLGSRKDVKSFIKKGRVRINNHVNKKVDTQIDPNKDEVLLDQEKVEYEPYIYLMMHKPGGYVTATKDNHDKTVVDLLQEEDKVLSPFPVGRLDKDTEGLLLLTNDGPLAHQLLSPKKNIKKKYFAKIDGVVTEKDVEAFKTGVNIGEGYITKPADLNILESGEVSSIEIAITEGKFHQVKRMFEAVDKKVIYLKRLGMGKLKLDDNLELGHYRRLTEQEKAILNINNG